MHDQESQGQATPPGSGRVVAIHVSPGKGLGMRRLERTRAEAGVGLQGDRYALGTGHYSPDRRVSRDLTLVEHEVIEDLRRSGVQVSPGETRRNITTQGIDLNAAVGRRFRIGTVECRGTRLCEPCAYLETVTGKPLLRPLVHRGGLRADILTNGEISIGDSIQILAERERLGVGVFVVRAGSVLLGLRRGAAGAGTWSTPGGQLEVAEPVQVCARRELWEETGLEAGATRILGETVDERPDGTRWRSTFVRADWVTGDPIRREPDRCETWQWFRGHELPTPLFAPVQQAIQSGLSPFDAG